MDQLSTIHSSLSLEFITEIFSLISEFMSYFMNKYIHFPTQCALSQLISYTLEL